MSRFNPCNVDSASVLDIAVDMSQEKFEYTPMSNPRTQFRLLHLLPGTYQDPIKCVLTIETMRAAAQVTMAPGYHAISYAWGNPAPTETIICNSKAMRIAENLYCALLCLRNGANVDKLWADAICINQADDTEKGFQVAQMAKIYQYATGTLIWLGVPNIPDPFRPVHDFVSYLNTFESDDLAPADPTKLDWQAFAQMLLEEFWTRRWVVQELVLSPSATLVYGAYTLPFTHFSRLIRKFLIHTPTEIHISGTEHFRRHLKRTEAAVATTAFVNAAAITQQITTHAQSAKRPLRRLLQMNSRFDISDPRDSVYALLGIHSLTPGSNLDIVPDYTLSAAEVFSQVVQILMHESEIMYSPLRDHESTPHVAGFVEPSELALRRFPRFERTVLLPFARKNNVSIADALEWLSLYRQCPRPRSAGLVLGESEAQRSLLRIYYCVQSLMGTFYAYWWEESEKWVPAVIGLRQRWCWEFGFEVRKMGARRWSMVEAWPRWAGERDVFGTVGADWVDDSVGRKRRKRRDSM